ncbi:50S ribosomal protein L6 [candidate division MSBL1 archaeon SCGC-AAA382C18]|uniref:Large ribosomal subunit protein uL6 n=1 Tax=candidate division MSBL1 archaeon SCGC-AAA382C18 TaxID=1698281 RepID=A0A133VJJ3_9EURY|nr:50S ribosomal protein L6 [candidate division MSBL1 archaeon SCGC-AAA382C18]
MLNNGITESVEIPEDVEISIDGKVVKVNGPNAELSRKFDIMGIGIKIEDKEAVVKSQSSKKKDQSAVGTVVSHIENMIEGVTEGFTSKLKVVYSHFPITVNVSGDKVMVENFIGEEEPRVANIVEDTEVDVDGEEITIEGPDKEAVGQTAANIEQATDAKNRDPRVFQDGIYIVERP